MKIRISSPFAHLQSFQSSKSNTFCYVLVWTGQPLMHSILSTPLHLQIWMLHHPSVLTNQLKKVEGFLRFLKLLFSVYCVLHRRRACPYPFPAKLEQKNPTENKFCISPYAFIFEKNILNSISLTSENIVIRTRKFLRDSFPSFFTTISFKIII